MPGKKLLHAATIVGCLFASAALVAGVMAEEHPALEIAKMVSPF